MQATNKLTLEQRVARAAEAALAGHRYVSASDVLTGMGLLVPTHIEDWRKGRIDFLERVIQGNLNKISSVMAAYRQWARQQGLRPSETAYVRRTRAGTGDLQFSKSGDPAIEKFYRTHFVSPELSERRRKSMEIRLSRAPEPAVFQIHERTNRPSSLCLCPSLSARSGSRPQFPAC